MGMTVHSLISFVAALAIVACSTVQDGREAPMPVVTEQRMPNIEHVSPARDAVGTAPARFEWTAAAGAEEYALGVWDDVDRLMWRSDHIPTTSVVVPKEVQLEFGTYYWSVTALREGRPIAESGRSAFVVTR